MDATAVIEAINGNESIFEAVKDNLLQNDKFKEVVENKASLIYQTKISDEVSKIHSSYDVDIETILGEKPKVNSDGTKQKTYEKNKELLTELSELRKIKNDLSVDSEIKRLKAENEKLINGGQATHWQKSYEEHSQIWNAKETALQKELDGMKEKFTQNTIKAPIQDALMKLSFNEAIPEVARKAMVDSVTNLLIKGAKIENDKVSFYDENNVLIVDNEFKANSAENILKTRLKEILKDNNQAGGGAPPSVSGGLVSKNVDGNDVKTLIISKPFDTKVAFNKELETILKENNVVRNSKEWNDLSVEAFTRYGVSKLPLQ
jgi:hypothetical protein